MTENNDKKKSDKQKIEFKFPSITKEYIIEVLGTAIQNGLYSLFTIMIITICILIGLLYWRGYLDGNDSDPMNGRSGLHVYTDHKTGCQYLSGFFGITITPRMHPDGTQVCKGVR